MGECATVLQKHARNMGCSALNTVGETLISAANLSVIHFNIFLQKPWLWQGQTKSNPGGLIYCTVYPAQDRVTRSLPWRLARRRGSRVSVWWLGLNPYGLTRLCVHSPMGPLPTGVYRGLILCGLGGSERQSSWHSDAQLPKLACGLSLWWGRSLSWCVRSGDTDYI